MSRRATATSAPLGIRLAGTQHELSQLLADMARHRWSTRQVGGLQLDAHRGGVEGRGNTSSQ